MSLERQVLFWTAALAAMCFALYVLGSSVTPFAAGMALGYLLDPVVSKMEKLGFNRLGASLLILVVFAATFVLALIVIAPILSNQLVAFAERLPGYAMRLQALAVDEGNLLMEKYGGGWMSTLVSRPTTVVVVVPGVLERISRHTGALLNGCTCCRSASAAGEEFSGVGGGVGT